MRRGRREAIPIRLIDADATFELARTDAYYRDFVRSTADLTSLRELLEDLPVIDAVPIVRCKNCKHKGVSFGKTICLHHTENARAGNYCDGACYVKDSDYCSYGEKREGNS